MLEFYYDVVDRYIDRTDFCLLEMDTGEIINYPYCTKSTLDISYILWIQMLFLADSLYLALSADSLDELVKPELREEWTDTKRKVFPRTDTPENTAYDKRTPGTVLVCYPGHW